MSMARDIINTVCETKKGFENEDDVIRIHLKLGQYAAVDPESLLFCFRLLAESAGLSGVPLEIEELPETSAKSIEVEVGKSEGKWPGAF